MRLYKRNDIFYVAYPGNQRQSLKTRDRAMAERLFKRLQKEVLLGNVIRLNHEKEIKLFDFRDEYLKYSSAHKAASTADRDRYSLKVLCENLGNVSLFSITPKMLDDFHTYLIDAGRKRTGTNITIRHLRSAFQKAVDWEYLKSNPYRKIKLFSVDEEDQRFYSEDELKLIFNTTKNDPDFHDLITVYLFTGMRRSELCFLQKQNINFETGMINIKKSKTGWHPIPMDKLVSEILFRRCRNQNVGRIFTKWKPNSITHRWIRLRDKLGLEGRLHDLRHTFASYLAMSAVNLRSIQKLMGHSQFSTTEKYAHLHPDYLRAEISKLEKWHNISTPVKLEIIK
jgi:integrase